MTKMRSLRCAVLLAAASLSSCGGDDDAGDGVPRQGGPGRPTCSNVEDRADALLDSAQSCAQDADCTLADLDAECIAALLCSVPLSVDADLERVRAEARALGQEAEACGGPCSFANCAPPNTLEVHCDPIAHTCEHGSSASSPDGGRP